MDDATQRELDMGYVQRVCNTKYHRPSQLGTGGFIFTTTEDDVVIVESDVKVLNRRTAAAASVPAKKLEGHAGGPRPRCRAQMSIGKSAVAKIGYRSRSKQVMARGHALTGMKGW